MNVAQIVENQKQAVRDGLLATTDQRIACLKKLRNLLIDNEKELCGAISDDFGKPYFESFSSEIYTTVQEIDFHIKHLSSWVKPLSVRGSLASFPSKNTIYQKPFGSVLIIGPWNYPINLIFQPLIGAISAGNAAVIKPSELAPATSARVKQLIENHFEPNILFVEEGGVETSEKLLSLPFDKIFFTGSPRIGKIVMKAAAEQLIPVTLELGGKSPAIVHEDANLEVSAKRIMWGKIYNAGQTCVAPDYAVVHESVYDDFITQSKSALKTFYKNDYKPGNNYTRIINEKHFNRLNTLLEGCDVVHGGTVNPDQRFIEPTLVRAGWDDEIMQDEIFGPILPVLTYSDPETMIQKINGLPPPLALYLFSDDKTLQDRVIDRVPFGGGCINDTVIQFANPHLPIGGVGQSGMGSYHGKYSFDTFSRQQPVVKKSFWPDPDLRYPPYDDSKLTWIKRFFMR